MILKATEDIKKDVLKLFIERWNTDFMVSRGKVHYVADLESLVLIEENRVVGLLTYTMENKEIEIVSLDSFNEGHGIGSALLEGVKEVFLHSDCQRLWLVTTNDNLRALRFYQKRQFTITDIHLNAVDHARKIKPSIPLTGYDNIPIQHEIELSYFKHTSFSKSR